MPDHLTKSRFTKIKFCGLFREEDITAVNRFLPDYAGFVFYEKSHRNVTRKKAGRLKALLDRRIKAVGVFVDNDPLFISDLAENGIIDIIQLHGHEDEEYIRKLRSLTRSEIIRAFRLDPEKPEDSAAVLAKALEFPSDHILIDSGMGSGKAFNWELLSGFKRPFFLAGGIDRENAAEAIKMLHPFALDISSGIETDRKKDPAKMADIMEIIKQIDQ